MQKRTSYLRSLNTSLVLGAALVGAPALAQEAAPAADPAAPAAAPASEQAPPPAAPGTTPTQEQVPEAGAATSPENEEAAGGTSNDRLTELEGKFEGMNEPFLEMQSTVAGLKKLKFSGYIQGRYEWHDDANSGLDANNRPLGTNRFFVRRSRLKAAYRGDLMEYVLQVDATTSSVALRDAEASLVLDNEVIPGPIPWELKLTVGQFKIPFGFEVLQSSGEREMPERALVIRRLFPGERDRGARLALAAGPFRLTTAVLNGTYNDTVYGDFDHSSWKDVVGRLGADFDWLVFGVSGYWGRYLTTQTPGRAAMGTMPAVLPIHQRFSRFRVGGDAQFYYDVPGLGGLSLRGEAILSQDERLGFNDIEPMDACANTNGIGWIGTVVQNVGDYVGVVFRADQFDPDQDVAMTCPETARTRADNDKVTAYGVGLLGYISGNLKLTLAYEHTIEQGTNKKDNDTFTGQLQARF